MTDREYMLKGFRNTYRRLDEIRNTMEDRLAELHRRIDHGTITEVSDGDGKDG